MFEISGQSSFPFKNRKENKAHRALINFLLLLFFFFSCISRSGDGTQDLCLCHSFRTGQVDAADGGQEVQVQRAALEPLALRSLLPGEHRRRSKSDLLRVHSVTSHCGRVTAALRQALEEGGAKEVPAPGSHLAVGGDPHPAHGAAGLHLIGSHHQRTETGEQDDSFYSFFSSK